MDTEKEGVSAWLLQVDRLINVAVGQFELIHIVDEPEYMSIPQAPEYCRHVILWNDNIVPVMNLTSWASGSLQAHDSAVVAILVYKDSQEKFLYGGVKLDNTPMQERVKNDQFCQLTENMDKWRAVSLSCFKTNAGDIVPIIDVPKLFSQHLDS